MKIVTAGIIRTSGNVMIARRASGEALEGFWEFPGGKLENNESLEDCLQRELFEELGIKAEIGEEIGRSIYRYDHGEIELVAFNIYSYSGKMSLTVHDKVEWVPIGQLQEFKLAPADIELLEYLRS